MLRRTYGQIRVWKMWCDYDTTATADAVSSSSQCTLMLLQQLSLLLLPSHSLFSFPKWENFDLALTQLTHFALHLVDYHCCCLKSDSLFITDCIMVHTLNPNFIFCGCIFFSFENFCFCHHPCCCMYWNAVSTVVKSWDSCKTDLKIPKIKRSVFFFWESVESTDEILLPSQMSPSSSSFSYCAFLVACLVGTGWKMECEKSYIEIKERKTFFIDQHFTTWIEYPKRTWGKMFSLPLAAVIIGCFLME